MKRAFWLSIGLVAVALGLLGAVLPLLPTTPFVLVAVFAFARSSPRLHAWLISHPRFGPAIANWQREGAISRGTKWTSVTAMIGALALSYVLDIDFTLFAVQAVVLVAAATFIISRPAPKPDRARKLS